MNLCEKKRVLVNVYGQSAIFKKTPFCEQVKKEFSLQRKRRGFLQKVASPKSARGQAHSTTLTRGLEH